MREDPVNAKIMKGKIPAGELISANQVMLLVTKIFQEEETLSEARARWNGMLDVIALHGRYETWKEVKP